jgi:hypothetical protein
MLPTQQRPQPKTATGCRLRAAADYCPWTSSKLELSFQANCMTALPSIITTPATKTRASQNHHANMMMMMMKTIMQTALRTTCAKA